MQIVETRSFPAPSEVDRELYDWITMNKEISDRFPAPPEVDRELYQIKKELESEN